MGETNRVAYEFTLDTSALAERLRGVKAEFLNMENTAKSTARSISDAMRQSVAAGSGGGGFRMAGLSSGPTGGTASSGLGYVAAAARQRAFRENMMASLADSERADNERFSIRMSGLRETMRREMGTGAVSSDFSPRGWSQRMGGSNQTLFKGYDLSDLTAMAGKKVGAAAEGMPFLQNLGITQALGKFGGALPGIGIAAGVGSLVSQAYGAASEKNASFGDLRRSFRAMGASNAEGEAKRIRGFAESMADVTHYTHEEVEAASALASRLSGLTGPALDEVAKVAIGLAARLGMDLPEATKLAERSMNGHTETLERYGVKITEGASAATKWQEVMAYSARGLDLEKEKLNSVSGVMSRLRKEWSDMLAESGQPLTWVVNWVVKKTAGAAVETIDAAREANADFGTLIRAFFGSEDAKKEMADRASWKQQSDNAKRTKVAEDAEAARKKAAEEEAKAEQDKKVTAFAETAAALRDQTSSWDLEAQGLTSQFDDKRMKLEDEYRKKLRDAGNDKQRSDVENWKRSGSAKIDFEEAKYWEKFDEELSPLRLRAQGADEWTIRRKEIENQAAQMRREFGPAQAYKADEWEKVHLAEGLRQKKEAERGDYASIDLTALKVSGANPFALREAQALQEYEANVAKGMDALLANNLRWSRRTEIQFDRDEVNQGIRRQAELMQTERLFGKAASREKGLEFEAEDLRKKGIDDETIQSLMEEKRLAMAEQPTFSGLTEMWDKIQLSAAQGGSDPNARANESTAKNTERSAATLEKVLAAIEKGFDKKNEARFAAGTTVG